MPASAGRRLPVYPAPWPLKYFLQSGDPAADKGDSFPGHPGPVDVPLPLGHIQAMSHHRRLCLGTVGPSLYQQKADQQKSQSPLQPFFHNFLLFGPAAARYSPAGYYPLTFLFAASLQTNTRRRCVSIIIFQGISVNVLLQIGPQDTTIAQEFAIFRKFLDEGPFSNV